jgi:hypothetical protein
VVHSFSSGGFIRHGFDFWWAAAAQKLWSGNKWLIDNYQFDFDREAK